jgi:histidinol phosphatase-like enzyme
VRISTEEIEVNAVTTLLRQQLGELLGRACAFLRERHAARTGHDDRNHDTGVILEVRRHL